ncbi:unnamed protein product [Ilex paraguariensis]|uniref:Uncharacterized protein n=1 Tax=Ilex paraguariensis TaxID=185542 RepID=A0ABC8R094_9AQUA
MCLRLSTEASREQISDRRSESSSSSSSSERDMSESIKEERRSESLSERGREMSHSSSSRRAETLRSEDRSILGKNALKSVFYRTYIDPSGSSGFSGSIARTESPILHRRSGERE